VRVLCCLVVWFQASRCLWDPSTDNYASAQYTNATIFCRYTTTKHAHAPHLNAPHSSVLHVPHVNAFAFLVSFFFFAACWCSHCTWINLTAGDGARGQGGPRVGLDYYRSVQWERGEGCTRARTLLVFLSCVMDCVSPVHISLF
jgi:hypothetical protein